MNIHVFIISFMLTILVWAIWYKSILKFSSFMSSNIENHFFRNKGNIEIEPIPDGREFDKHFLNVMRNKIKRDKLSDESMYKLYAMISEENKKQELDYIKSIDYSKKC